MNQRTDKIESGHAPAFYEPLDAPHYEALERTGFFGAQAAGAVTIAADTGRMMLVLRSEQVLEPGTYGNNGGAHGTEETPLEAAIREHLQETGWTGGFLARIPALRFVAPGFVYSNFVFVVPHEFDPELGWEATDATWCTLDDLPSPLHFGIEALLDDPESREIVSGGWRRHVDEDVFVANDHVETSPDASVIEWDATPRIFRKGERPLSEQTMRRVAEGIRKILNAHDAIQRAAGSALGLIADHSTTSRDDVDAEPRDDRTPNAEHEFVLVLEGNDLPEDDVVDKLYATCDDGLLCLMDGELTIHFVREGLDAKTAMHTAIEDVSVAGLKVLAIRMESVGDESIDDAIDERR